ncbi:MAG: hypothetical protein LBH05_07490 [Deferribacteraceae bacterium]|jgi:hypothetical protein|nr:hypothetical protein [Deferribacteraceae bacterium]
MCGKNFLLLTIISSLLLSGCAAPVISGSVNVNVRNFDDFSQEKKKKSVNYFCSFDKIVTRNFNAFGDYCLKADNHDYVSYFMTFDIQSTTGFASYLMQSVSEIKSNNTNYKYYQIYSNNNLNKLSHFDFDTALPTSFAVTLDSASYAVVITKKDLLARVTVYPGLFIRSLKPDNNSAGDLIKDYSVTFSIPPYSFKVYYDDSVIGRLLGLPDYSELTGVLTAERKAELKAYNDALNEYWKSPEKFKYNPDKITVVDYAIPHLGAEKFKNHAIPADLPLRTGPLTGEEKFINAYLPYYELRSLDIVELSGSGENILKTFTIYDISNVMISLDDSAALVYKGKTGDGQIIVRYNHEAVKPQISGLQKNYSERMGIGYIYSDIASTIETNLNIEKFYPLEKLPINCIDNNKWNKKESLDKLLPRLSKEKARNCTIAQKSIGSALPDLY